MTQPPICPRGARGGYALPVVLLFLTLAFGAWAIVFRSSGTALRVENARSHRAARSTWVAPATARGLRLLQTGTPPLASYTCKLALTQAEETRYFRLTFEKIDAVRWTVSCAATAADDDSPDMPASF